MRVMLAPIQVPSTYPKYWGTLRYPVYGSPKLDGIRAVADDKEVLRSRSWKPIPSAQAQDEFSSVPWVDGEVIEGCVTDFGVYNRTQSHVMSANKPGHLSYHIFDYPHPMLRDAEFKERLSALSEIVLPGNYLIVPQKELYSKEECLEYIEEQLELGYEGAMFKHPLGWYKEGRATLGQGLFWKYKEFVDAEGIVESFVEELTNNNTQEKDERGYAKRSSAKAGKQAAGTLGKFKVRYNGELINVSTGKFTDKEKLEIWKNQDFYEGKILKFKFFAHGIKDQPRHARAIGWRSELDL